MVAHSTGRGKLLAAGAFLTIATAALYLHRLHRTRKSNKGSSITTKRRPKDITVPPEILQMFEASTLEAKKLTNIENVEKLILYSLYKQSNEGDAPEKYGGSLINVVERAKYSAWERLRGMSTAQAMIHYIEAVKQLRAKGCMDKDGVVSSIEGITTDDFDLDFDVGGVMGNKPSSLAHNSEDDGDGYQGKDLTTAQKLLRASAQNNVQEIQSILSANPELVHHRDEDGQSALHLAADKGSVDALRTLMELGADPNAADGDGITVLQAAVIAENFEACRVLLQQGANPDQTDVDGDTPRKCAEEDGSKEMKQLFASYNTSNENNKKT